MITHLPKADVSLLEGYINIASAIKDKKDVNAAYSAFCKAAFAARNPVLTHEYVTLHMVDYKDLMRKASDEAERLAQSGRAHPILALLSRKSPARQQFSRMSKMMLAAQKAVHLEHIHIHQPVPEWEKARTQPWRYIYGD